MKRFAFASILLLWCLCGTAQSRADSLLYVFTHPDEGRVMIAAHRGLWRTTAENSIESIEAAIAEGLDIVELDVRRTRDGVLILMHDKTLARTTNGWGPVSWHKYSYIKKLRLQGPGGKDYHVPTLKEALETARGRILVNLDMEVDRYDDAYAVAKETGTLDQVIFKTKRLPEELAKKTGIPLDSIIFMPKIPFEDPIARQNIALYETVSTPVAFEISGGPRISLYMALELRKDHRTWVNSLWKKGDNDALEDPEKAWGKWIRIWNAGVIQTDYGPELKAYLETLSE